MSDLPNLPKAAALSQTAGVAEGMVLLPRDQLEGIVERLSVGMESFVRKESDALHDLLASAPAASGGEEVSRTLPIDVRGQWYEVPIPVHLHVVSLRERLNNPATFFHDDTALANWLDSLHATNDDGASTDEKWEPAQRAAAFLRGELPPQAPQPPAAASVSERALELRERAEAHGSGVFVSTADMSALEQALTQQRGECEASVSVKQKWPKRHQFPKPDEHGNETGSIGEHAYAEGWNACLDEAKRMSGVPMPLKGKKGVVVVEDTTPQPSADAVRELVQRAIVALTTHDQHDWALSDPTLVEDLNAIRQGRTNG